MAQEWIVQHEMDDEPTYVTPVGDDGEYVTLGTDMPVAQRLEVGKSIAALLNNNENNKKTLALAKKFLLANLDKAIEASGVDIAFANEDFFLTRKQIAATFAAYGIEE